LLNSLPAPPDGTGATVLLSKNKKILKSKKTTDMNKLDDSRNDFTTIICPIPYGRSGIQILYGRSGIQILYGRSGIN